MIDDDSDFAGIVDYLLSSSGHSCFHVTGLEEARDLLDREGFDLCLLDYRLGDQDGIDLIEPLRGLAPQTPIAVLTACQDPEVVVRALRSGAGDFLTKPVDTMRLLATLGHALRERDLAKEVARLEADRSTTLLGQSRALLRARSLLETVAPTDATVLITGESGTGKELAARFLHEHSSVGDGPLVPINMATLPSELAESTLFGHEKGAFTGATERRDGACAAADEGTLFLDEIGEMPLDLQAKILRFLQEGTYRRVGSSREQKSRARIVAATNRDLPARVREGEFREDLYYRLNVVPIGLPPLRERDGDIDLLAQQALAIASKRHGREFRRIDALAMERLREHSWPGNVRELFHLIERIVILEEGPTLTRSMLPPSFDAVGHPTAETTEVASPSPRLPDIRPLAEVEQATVVEAIRLRGGSIPKAAEELQISPATIYRRLKSWRIDPATLRA